MMPPAPTTDQAAVSTACLATDGEYEAVWVTVSPAAAEAAAFRYAAGTNALRDEHPEIDPSRGRRYCVVEYPAYWNGVPAAEPDEAGEAGEAGEGSGR